MGASPRESEGRGGPSALWGKVLCAAKGMSRGPIEIGEIGQPRGEGESHVSR